jgi:peptide/nickel transport system substrate-binding protein
MTLPVLCRHAALVVVLASVFAACAAPSPPAAKIEGGTVTIRTNGAFSAVDPILPLVAGAGQIGIAAYDTLLAFDSEGKLVGSIAKSWTNTPTSVSLMLKTGVTCSDGTAVTPTVVVQSLQRFLDKSPFAARPFGQKTVTLAADDKANTVTLTLATPYNEAVYGLAANYTSIVCPAGFAPDADFATKSYGTGEYTLAEVTADRAVLKLRKDWSWGPFDVSGSDPGVPDTINIQVVTNETTSANLLLTGGLDIAAIVGNDNTRLRAEPKLVNRSSVVYNPWIMHMNEAPSRVTADPQVRKAVMQSVDQDGWNKAALAGLGVTSPSFLGTKGICFSDTSGLLPPVSTSAARATLQAARYSGGASGRLSKDGKPVSIEVLATAQHGGGGEYLVNQLTEAGFAARLRNIDVNAFRTAFNAGDFDVMVGYYSNAGANPGPNINFFYGAPPPNGTNLGSIDDPVLTDAIQKALTAPESERCAAWKVVQERFLMQYHILPVAAASTQWYSPKGWSFFAAAQNLETRSLHRVP